MNVKCLEQTIFSMQCQLTEKSEQMGIIIITIYVQNILVVIIYINTQNTLLEISFPYENFSAMNIM